MTHHSGRRRRLTARGAVLALATGACIVAVGAFAYGATFSPAAPTTPATVSTDTAPATDSPSPAAPATVTEQPAPPAAPAVVAPVTPSLVATSSPAPIRRPSTATGTPTAPAPAPAPRTEPNTGGLHNPNAVGPDSCKDTEQWDGTQCVAMQLPTEVIGRGIDCPDGQPGYVTDVNGGTDCNLPAPQRTFP